VFVGVWGSSRWEMLEIRPIPQPGERLAERRAAWAGLQHICCPEEHQPRRITSSRVHKTAGSKRLQNGHWK